MKNISSQILCINCFKQNDSISKNVHSLILNGGFELTNCNPIPAPDKICPSATGYNCNISNWVVSGGSISTYAGIMDNTLSIIVEGSRAVYLGNSNCNICSSTFGDTTCIEKVCEIKGIPNNFPRSGVNYGGTNGVSIEQLVNGLVIGKTYALEFWVGGEGGFNINYGVFAIDIGFGQLFLTNNASNPGSLDKGTRYVIQFKAITNSHLVKFTNWGHICGTCTEVIIDNVRLFPISELSNTVKNCDSSYIDNSSIKDSLYIPNVFTPNNEEPNNLFKIIYLGNEKYELAILNRWGDLVFSTIDKSNFWDGKVNEIDSPDGVYYYILSIGEKKYYGFLSLFR